MPVEFCSALLNSVKFHLVFVEFLRVSEHHYALHVHLLHRSRAAREKALSARTESAIYPYPQRPTLRAENGALQNTYEP